MAFLFPFRKIKLGQSLTQAIPNAPRASAGSLRTVRPLLLSLQNGFFSFADFEEGEDNEEVLMTLCAELQRLFESFGDNAYVREKCCVPWLAESFTSLSNLLLRMMLHRDRNLRGAALGAYVAFIAACTSPTMVKNKIVPQVLELSEDQRDAFRQTGALVLPAALHCIRRCSSELQKGQRPQEATQDKQYTKDLQELKRQLITAYIRLCADKSCAIQIAAGQQLPLFVDFIAAEVEALQRGQPLQQKLSDGSFAEDAFEGNNEIGELMVAAYTATQKFTMSLHVGSLCAVFSESKSQFLLPGLRHSPSVQ